MGTLLSWLTRAIPVNRWTVLAAVGAFVLWYKGAILVYLARAIPHDVVYPNHRHERNECFVDASAANATAKTRRP